MYYFKIGYVFMCVFYMLGVDYYYVYFCILRFFLESCWCDMFDLFVDVLVKLVILIVLLVSRDFIFFIVVGIVILI